MERSFRQTHGLSVDRALRCCYVWNDMDGMVEKKRKREGERDR